MKKKAAGSKAVCFGNNRRAVMALAAFLAGCVATLAVIRLCVAMSVSDRSEYGRFLDLVASFERNFSMESTLAMSLTVDMDLAGDGTEVPVPADIQVEYSAQVADGLEHGEMSMFMLLAGSDVFEYGSESYSGGPDGSYARTSIGYDDYGDWVVTDSDLSALDWDAFLDSSYYLPDTFASSSDGYEIQADAAIVSAAGLDQILSSVLLDAWTPGVSYDEVSAVLSFDRDGRLVDVNMTPVRHEADGWSIDASWRVMFSGFGGVSDSEVTVPDDVAESASQLIDGQLFPDDDRYMQE